MKIAIIGGGIFGTNIALALSKLEFVKEITIFEKNKNILLEASVNNQHRYHLGYHYPRSPQTIEQILFTNELYNEYYKDSIFDINNNIYFVSKYESLIDTDTFSSVFKNHDVKQVELTKYKSFVNINNLESAFLVKEKGINTNLLSKLIKHSLEKNTKIKISYNTEVTDICKLKKEFNIVVNASYYNNNLTDNSDLKYEVCLLPVLNKPFKDNDIAFTVVDGKFPSIYPTQDSNIYTLSHVSNTPLIKTDSLLEAQKFRNSLDNLQLLKYSKNMIDESRQFFSFNNIDIVNFYVSYKVKIKDDKNDLRTSNIMCNDNVISILQGKITTCIYVAEEISKYVKNYNNR